MPWRQQASRPIQCRSCIGRMPLRGVLRRSRLPERNRHAGDFWRPKACLMTGLGQGEPDSSRIGRAKGVLAIVLARDRSLGVIRVPSNANVRALQAAQPWAPNSAADGPPRIRQCPHIDAEQLASAAPSHSTSADTHPRTPTGTRVRVASHACALPMTQAHAHYRSSTLTLKLRHFSARREASTLFRQGGQIW